MAEKETKSSVVPQEYVDKMIEFDIDAWRKKRIEDALKYQSEREWGTDVPSWWEGGESYNDKYESPKYGTWWNCISTATDCFDNREGRYATGNKSFITPSSNTYYEKLGFRRLGDEEESQLGDIYQIGYDAQNPYHAMMLTGKNDDGTNHYTWGTGFQAGINRGRYDYEGEGKVATRYRYVGRPEDVADIQTHNDNVKKYREATAPLSENRSAVLLKTKPLDKSINKEDAIKKSTVEWLENMVSNKKKK
jgi:hypothetical protein